MRVTTGFLASATMLLSTACGGIPLTAGADLEPGYDFTSFRSYAWDEPDDLPTGDPRLDNNPFFVHRLHAAIHWELATRGIEYDAGSPQLEVHHHAVVRDRTVVYETAPNAMPLQSGDRTEVIQFHEGTFLVDIADARTGEVIWRGWAQLDLGSALDDPMEMRDQIDRAIRTMFERFPVPYGGFEPAELYEGR